MCVLLWAASVCSRVRGNTLKMASEPRLNRWLETRKRTADLNLMNNEITAGFWRPCGPDTLEPAGTLWSHNRWRRFVHFHTRSAAKRDKRGKRYENNHDHNWRDGGGGESDSLRLSWMQTKRPSCKSIITMKEAFLRFTVFSFSGKTHFQFTIASKSLCLKQ